MDKDVKKELLRIKKDIENEIGISYSELAYLQSHQKEIMELQDIQLAEWSGITEEEWNNGKLNEEMAVQKWKLQ